MSLVTITVPPLSGGVGTFAGPNYATVLTEMAAKITALDAELAKVNAQLLATNASLATVAADMGVILQFLTAIQTPTGELRTFDLTSVSNNTLVTSALTKAAIPVPLNPGV